MAGTIPDLIFHGRLDMSMTALMSVEGRVITYRQLHDQMAHTVAGLNSIGLGPGDRVATLIPNGPVMATMLLSVASGFACIPLNPSLRRAELDQHFADVNPRCLLVPSEAKGEAIDAAVGAGVEVLEVESAGAVAGAFTIKGLEKGGSDPVWAGNDDTVLMMQTSGTTAKPKLVALSGSIVAHSVTSIAERLGLTEDDDCINVLPLFHVHGQMVVLSTLSTGGSVVCAPGFDPEKIFAWFARFKPTWYSAVPTMHRAMLDLAQADREAIPRGRLRFIRSASSALPVRLIHDLEDAFGVPVIEAYGMTEASHGITSNLVPPGRRKAGSVGIPYRGEEVSIVDEGGRRLGAGETGEIVIRGKNVITGYMDNPEANARSFVDGWLRTGDLGYLDEEGYLYIVGRKKDVINRGGEKIAPREVEEALLEAEGVSQAIAFPVPHPTLGEDIAAAVVAKTGHRVDGSRLRAGLMERIAQHKVPQRIFVVDEIPKGPTGKPQRWEMVKALGIDAGSGRAAHAPSEQLTSTEEKVQRIWREVLKRDDVGMGERFLEAGGDSLRVTQLASRLRAEFGVEVDMGTLFDTDTIQEQAKLVESRSSEKTLSPRKDR